MLTKSKLKNFFFLFIFNFNTIGLPIGIMWSNIFSLFFIIYLFSKRYLTYVVLILFAIVCYAYLQYLSIPIINMQSFILSMFYFFTSVICGLFFYIYFNQERTKYEEIFEYIIKGNAILLFIAIPSLFIPVLKDFFWHTSTNINSYGELRLQLFYYEPSHLNFVLLFFLLYLLLNVIFYKEKNYFKYLIITFLAIFLTKSLGTLAALFFALLISFIIFFIPILRYFMKKVTLLFVALVFIVIIAGDTMTERLNKFIEGGDNSGNVRLIYSTVSAYNMIEKYNYELGVGFGQTKYYIIEFTSKIPGYGSDRLPNTISSTMATVGMYGLILKHLILLFFFFKKKIYKNLFKLTAFFFLVLYSFVGGWMMNVYELIFFGIIFSNAFKEFDYEKIFKKYQ